MQEFTRRKFLKGLAVATAGAVMPHTLLRAATPAVPPGLAVAHIQDRPQMKEALRLALDAIGGIGKFVQKGQIVAIKPNMAWSRTPEQGANVSPELVAAMVELCKQAGAEKVKVFDRTINKWTMSYRLSGIEDAAKKAGADVSFVNEKKFRKINIPQGKVLKSWPVYRDALDADVFINMPVAKQHASSVLTLSMKNLMGIAGGDRGTWHPDIHQKLADFNSVIKVDLIVMDAYRIMVTNGPAGGRPDDLKFKGQIIVGTDRVAVDAYTTTLFDLDPQSIGYIRRAADMGIGKMDFESVGVKQLTIG
jgi:uncharacterized protein (DUF362 family)